MSKKHPERMYAIGLCKQDKICVPSGMMTAQANTDYWAKLERAYANDLPWKGLEEIEDRQFRACAEAKVWLEIKSRGKNPRSFVLVAFNQGHILVAPCQNCGLWAEQAFREVVYHGSGYRPHSKQNPHGRRR